METSRHTSDSIAAVVQSGSSDLWQLLAVAAVVILAAVFLVRRFTRRGGACTSCPSKRACGKPSEF